MGRDTRKARATTETGDPRSSHSSTAARRQSGGDGNTDAARRVRRSSGDKNERTIGKPPEKTPANCKAPPPVYSRPWFAAFLADALVTADTLGACTRADVTLLDLARLRAIDPAADAAMIELDQLAALLARQAVVHAAASGDLRAVRALADGSLDRVCADAAASPVGADRPTVGGAWMICPHCNATILVTGELDSLTAELIVEAIHPRDVARRIEQEDLHVPPVPSYLVEYYSLERWTGGEAHEPGEQTKSCAANAETITEAPTRAANRAIPISR